MKTSKKVRYRFLFILFIPFALVVGLFVVPYFANIVMPWQKAEAISTTLRWGGLANLPIHSRHISADMRGSMFTREYIVRFDADSTEIKDWLNSCKRINGNTPIMEIDGQIKCSIFPGENGAAGGTIRIDNIKGQVIIDMSHS